jgi:hypothetical protein
MLQTSGPKYSQCYRRKSQSVTGHIGDSDPIQLQRSWKSLCPEAPLPFSCPSVTHHMLLAMLVQETCCVSSHLKVEHVQQCTAHHTCYWHRYFL